MKILLGTTNPSKANRFRKLLTGYDAEFLTLGDMGITDEPAETGSTPAENAAIKAAFYGRYADRVICSDSGLYFDSLPMDDPRQPGLHVRSPEGVRLDDEEMIAYYSALIRSLGGRVTAYYADGIAVFGRGTVSVFSDTREKLLHSAFYMVDVPSEKRHPGWPLDSLSLRRGDMTYFTAPAAEDKNGEDDAVFIDGYRRNTVRFLVGALGLSKIL